MATFHVVLRRAGPQWDPTRPMEQQAATLADDPWNETHLRIDAIEPWTIRLRREGA